MSNQKDLDSLNQFIKSDRPLLLVLGDNEQNTRLLAEFQQTLPTHYKIINKVGSPQTQIGDFIRDLCQSLSLELNPAAANTQEQLEELVHQVQNQDQPSVFMINNADQLNLSGLAAISHIARMQEKAAIMLHIVLCGSADLKDKFKNLAPQLPPILVQLAEKNTATDKPTNPYRRGSESIWQKHGVKITSSVCLIVLAVGFWWHNHNKKILAPAPVIQKIPRAMPNPRAENEINSTKPASAKQIGSPFSQKPELTTNEKSVSSVDETIKSPKSLATKKTLATLAALKKEKSQASVKKSEEKKSDSLNAEDDDLTIADNKKNNDLRLEKKLTANYTVQLLASHEIKRARKFISSHHLAKASVHIISKNNEVFYIVTLGQYNTKQNAQNAVAHLPKDLKDLGAWVRKVNKGD